MPIFWRVPLHVCFSLALSLTLFSPICSLLLCFQTRCTDLAAFQSVTAQASKVLLKKIRRCSQRKRSQGTPAEVWALQRLECCFLYFGEWAHLLCYFPTLKGWMLLPIPDPASSRMDVHGDSWIFFTLQI